MSLRGDEEFKSDVARIRRVREELVGFVVRGENAAGALKLGFLMLEKGVVEGDGVFGVVDGDGGEVFGARDVGWGSSRGVDEGGDADDAGGGGVGLEGGVVAARWAKGSGGFGEGYAA
jgi:hypothetical protein